MKENKQVIAFHKKLGALETGEDKTHYYFDIFPENIDQKKQRYLKFIR